MRAQIVEVCFGSQPAQLRQDDLLEFRLGCGMSADSRSFLLIFGDLVCSSSSVQGRNKHGVPDWLNNLGRRDARSYLQVWQSTASVIAGPAGQP